MAKYKGEISQEAIDRKRREGRGQGEGHSYLPWLTIHEVPSDGRAHQAAGWKTDKRDHQLLSDGELHCFYVFEWARNVVDIREQYPLPLEATLEIAESMGVKHPLHPTSKHSTIMTTDFLLTVQKGDQRVFHPWSFKYSIDLNVKGLRTAEKLEIERIYWQSVRNCPWSLVTERQLPIQLAKNVEIIHKSLDLTGFNLIYDEVEAINAWLTPRIQLRDTALRHLTTMCDTSLGFECGTSLRVAYHLIANRRWIIDMHSPIEPGNILIVQNL
ncbi:heteromeric transposase endonuclease subunit TnsA [Leptolyngbya sp. NIES-2104]|uniref:heteromeric transposase endonuclease subunit TnsA n=1 Tax=Leptolyngbya sp. NIES-2104 TaxID=1552121 RepID=UPI0006ECC223|nr:heteromeric transposase endonuclease subunit TnsA [Leptolyngbya sp. NIES-2104]GAP97960.1 Tn7-like transposition protein A [Leptolyngbya sp. NIES-2104]